MNNNLFQIKVYLNTITVNAYRNHKIESKNTFNCYINLDWNYGCDKLTV